MGGCMRKDGSVSGNIGEQELFWGYEWLIYYLLGRKKYGNIW